LLRLLLVDILTRELGVGSITLTGVEVALGILLLLLSHHLVRLLLLLRGFLFLGREIVVDPLDLQIRIVLGEVVVVEGLLREEGRDNIRKCDEGITLLGFHGHLFDFSEDFEDL
jgi:hypothetical protein